MKAYRFSFFLQKNDCRIIHIGIILKRDYVFFYETAGKDILLDLVWI